MRLGQLRVYQPSGPCARMAAQSCAGCGQPLAGDSQYCPRCGAQVAALRPDAAEESSSLSPRRPVSTASASSQAGFSPTPTRPTQVHTRRNVGVALAIVLLLIVAFTVVPVPHGFSATVSSSWDAEGPATESFPSGSTVSGMWSTADGFAVTFNITDAAGHSVYFADASFGSFSFTASNSPYTMKSSSLFSETISVSGSYSSPVL
jgi:hypothetical protein